MAQLVSTHPSEIVVVRAKREFLERAKRDS